MENHEYLAWTHYWTLHTLPLVERNTQNLINNEIYEKIWKHTTNSWCFALFSSTSFPNLSNWRFAKKPGRYRLQARPRQSGAETDSMRLGYAHVVNSIREFPGKFRKPGTVRHGSRYGYDFFVSSCKLWTGKLESRLLFLVWAILSSVTLLYIISKRCNVMSTIKTHKMAPVGGVSSGFACLFKMSYSFSKPKISDMKLSLRLSILSIDNIINIFFINKIIRFINILLLQFF